MHIIESAAVASGVTWSVQIENNESEDKEPLQLLLFRFAKQGKPNSCYIYQNTNCYHCIRCLASLSEQVVNGGTSQRQSIQKQAPTRSTHDSNKYVQSTPFLLLSMFYIVVLKFYCSLSLARLYKILRVLRVFAPWLPQKGTFQHVLRYGDIKSRCDGCLLTLHVLEVTHGG